MYREITNCRSCHSISLTPVLDLGSQSINGFPFPEEPDPPKVPLKLVLCGECQLLQLKHTTAGDLLYREFWYRSAITQTMRDALKDIVESAQKRVTLHPGDTVIDIGSNDSTLLENWSPKLDRIGFEPATNLMGEARKPGLTVVNDYFSLKALREVSGKKAKVITAIACFYDLDDPNSFCQDVAESLSEDGIFVIQQAYLPEMLRQNDIGNIVPEHLTYQSLHSLRPMLERAGLYLFDVEVNSVNGGSFRTYASKQRRQETAALAQMQMREAALGLGTMAPYEAFAQRAQVLKGLIKEWVASEKANGGRVYIYGCSTKANIMLPFWGIGREDVCGGAERDQRKVGRVTPNTRIPIVDERVARLDATAFLVMPFFFKREIVEREQDFLSKGGKLVFPLPQLSVITSENLN